jgi:tetratricopeptide (TPR) repeat protein/transglutaminase-like putative cysteine protease
MRHYYALAAVALTSACLALGQDISSGQPAFSVPPQALQKAFSAIEPGANPVTVLLEEGQFDFDAAGRQTFRHRMIFKVWTKAGAEDWAMMQQSWAPWLEDRPTLSARVVSQDGTVHEFDPKTVADAPVRDDDEDVVTDRRMVRAPLPAIEAGSIVEQEIVTRQTVEPPVPGTVAYFYFGASVPTQRTILRVRGPQNIPFRYKVRLLPDVVTTDQTKGGIREIVFDQGPMKPLEEVAPLLPADAPRSPHVVFSTANDWKSVAGTYASIVEERLKGFDAAKYLPDLPPNAAREAKILAIVDKLNREIRYTGIEFSEASVIPHKPSEVLEHKYGDCKDKSTLAIALLRAAGIDAYVALLDSSEGEDIEPDLPGLGGFDHAIVYVPGQPDIWIDPTDPDLRIRVVSPENQGRNALIVRPETAALLRTPELTAEDNRVVETREFRLSELGRAKVTETSETFGTADREYRASFGDKDRKALHDNLKSYVEWTYAEAKIGEIAHGERSDLTKPFQLKIELEDVQRGTTARTEAAVGIRVSQIALRLPKYFNEDPAQKKDDTKPEPKPRTQDFAIPGPFTYDWHYVIAAPTGFRVRQLPEATEEKLGPATLTTRFTSENATTIRGELRFVMPKRRFSAAEGVALRDAVVELGKRKMMLLYFDQIGETDLASGKVKEALAEFARLGKLHPNEALHAMQTARALLAAGAGNTARAEARRAVALEPASAKAYVQLAEVLTHDLVGRPMAKGYDQAGAVAAYRKALELDPKDDETRANLAILLEYNRAAIRYGQGGTLEEALVEYKQIVDKLAALGLPDNYGIALLRAGHPRELRDYLLKQPDSENNGMLRVCAEAMLNGSEAGLRAAGAVSGVQAKQRVLASAAQTLLSVRRYELAADMFEAVAAGAPNPAAMANLVQILRKTKKLEDVAQTIQQPEDALRAFMARVIHMDSHEKDWTEPLSPFLLADETPDDADTARRALASKIGNLKTSGLTLEVAADIGVSALQFPREGSDETGWVIRMVAPGGASGGGQSQVWFVNKENGSYRLLTAPGDFSGVGRLVLKLVNEGKTELARTWLDRVRQELPAGGGDDPLSGAMFSRVWHEGQNADAQAIRLAAALLLSDKPNGIASTIAVLEEARKTVAAPAAGFVAASLAEAYLIDKSYDKALATSKSILSDQPESAVAFTLALRSAYALGGKEAADRIANANLARFKNNMGALRSAAATALSYADTERAIAIEKQIVDSGRGEVRDYNELAWADVVAGKVTAATLETANRGTMLGNNSSTALMHTLASVEVELGKTAEARAALLQRIDADGEDEPDDNDWYVFGRIAEEYGLADEAAAMYRRLRKPKDTAIASSCYALAQRRLGAMGTP